MIYDHDQRLKKHFLETTSNHVYPQVDEVAIGGGGVAMMQSVSPCVPTLATMLFLMSHSLARLYRVFSHAAGGTFNRKLYQINDGYI